MVFDGGRLVFAACCGVIEVVCCVLCLPLGVVCGLMLAVRCWLYVVCCLVRVARWLLFGVCCLLCDV